MFTRKPPQGILLIMPEKSELFVSICVPTYKRTEYIRNALQSCLNQTYPHFEVIISDDSAHDEIKKIADSFHSEKISYFKNTPPLGLCRKLNDFLDKARGDWVVFLCDDDLFDREFLSTLVAHIHRFPDAAMVRCRYKLMGGDGQVKRLDIETPMLLSPFEHLSRVFLPNRETFTMNATGVLFPKELMKSVGGFKSFYEGFHTDRLAWAELSAKGTTICEPTPLCSIRIHIGSASAVAFKLDYEERIAAALETQTTVQKLLQSMAGNATSEEDKKLLSLTSKHLKDYTRRSLSSAFDRNLIAALSLEKKNIRREVDSIFRKLKELGVPTFRSARIYRLLSYLPYKIRIIFLKIIQRKKIEYFGNLLKG